MFLVRPAVGLKTWKNQRKSTFRWRIRALRAVQQARGGGPFQGTTRQEGSGPLLARKCGCGDRRQARTKSWSSETLEIRWENKGKPACAPSLPQAPWCFPAIGDSMPCRRCIAMREAQANSPEPHSGSHSSHCSRTCRKLCKISAFYRSRTDV